MMSNNSKDKAEGEKVMSAYSKLMADRKKDNTLLPQDPKSNKLKSQNSKGKDSWSNSSVSSAGSSKRF